MIGISYTYKTSYSIQECTKKLMSPPQRFCIDRIFFRDYEVEMISETKLIITFTKGYNLTNHRTKYQATFLDKNDATYILMEFVGEKWNFPYPFVSDYEITKLFKERINATLV